jgi:hypothetical protein
MGLFSSSRPTPQTVPSDRIIPVTFWDDQDFARGMSLDITLTFNDVLDPEKLRASLDILFEKKGWEKFGARLRKNVRLTHTSARNQKTQFLTYQNTGQKARISYPREI